MSSPRVVGLNVHPVKSTAIRAVESVFVEPAGFAGDRRFMVVDTDGQLVSAREVHRLFAITADVPATDPTLAGGLRLRADGVDDLLVGDAEGDEVPVRLHRHDLTGLLVSRKADDWISAVVGRPGLRLVRCVDPTRRALNPAFSREGDHTAYADGYPVTLASLRSLAQLNDWIAEGAVERGETQPDPMPIERFRPNVVIDGDLDAFVEDSWGRVRLGDVDFRVAKPVDRCVMTTIDPVTLATSKEPIRTLSRHRRWDGTTWFAIQLIPDNTGAVRLGDRVLAD
ncbi:molybdenum cofactor biosysynthesis protein [Knoellia sinensis KCTC 19936]|uniref:Molybdenum cofactor biosysynthesis protein n=1 Tax=Knoellia sinensis KCTC 19936 TaxID=1385520 RepID=A0A0A0J8F8_9MICO|nr:MOSC N-terminal beta barrel domain-containing protein [Knoellia sinensis]KGN33705.1 molybdenum cofactor biosysynthesis protein [Knoellia sinensis KCTC 19936]